MTRAGRAAVASEGSSFWARNKTWSKLEEGEKRVYHRDQENLPWKALFESFQLVDLMCSKDQILKFRRKKPHKLKVASFWGTLRRVLHAPENPHCTANEGALRAANLHSTQWYLCRGGTKAVPLRDSFNMIQRKGWTPAGIGKFSISLPVGWAPPHFRSCLHCSVFA